MSNKSKKTAKFNHFLIRILQFSYYLIYSGLFGENVILLYLSGFPAELNKALPSNFLLHKKIQNFMFRTLLEVPPGFEPGIEVLQTFALPLGYGTILYFTNYTKILYNDSKGIWTPVTAVKGRCLNRLTMEPGICYRLYVRKANSPCWTRTNDTAVNSRMLYRLS